MGITRGTQYATVKRGICKGAIANTCALLALQSCRMRIWHWFWVPSFGTEMRELPNSAGQIVHDAFGNYPHMQVDRCIPSGWSVEASAPPVPEASRSSKSPASSLSDPSPASPFHDRVTNLHPSRATRPRRQVVSYPVNKTPRKLDPNLSSLLRWSHQVQTYQSTRTALLLQALCSCMMLSQLMRVRVSSQSNKSAG